ncbi:UDP-3-O-acyl-N-acetylglucosamine deacetylase [Motiliproteus sediminis]|uniref:UDP-3-O-acyl-N-acetylglucosamine deacetylase n=1 Tax=Motiliproteus sediminis TaxID=1468178 RepID=UPI001AEFBA62|nr:UDP-3-O-acyl-N-acetylglucosamine deacetylase [Motiliproteus sediminis]
MFIHQPRFTPIHPMQHTLANSFSCIGTGLHSGIKVMMTVMPAAENNGYTFHRRDLPVQRAEVAARYNRVTDTRLSTTISNEWGTRISTVEHLLAALYASGVDNAHIVLDGPEVPIMDGSALPFTNLISQSGIRTQFEPRQIMVINRAISVSDGDSVARLGPAAAPEIEMQIDFDSEAIGRQQLRLPISADSFSRDLAGARTFGFREQLDTLTKLGLAKGGNLHNAILIAGDRVMNPDGLRYSDEFVRHKVLDALGDLALAGYRFIGRFSGYRTGHALNNQLLHALMRSGDSWELWDRTEGKQQQVR